MSVQHKNPAPNPAARAQVAYQAIATMLVQGGLPPDAIEHLKAAHESILAHATSLATPQDPDDEGGVPLGESVAATRRRANGEDPEDRDDEEENGDEAPPDKIKGDKENPLSLVKRWASTTTKDDEPEEKPKPAATLAKGGRPRFLGRGR